MAKTILIGVRRGCDGLLAGRTYTFLKEGKCESTESEQWEGPQKDHFFVAESRDVLGGSTLKGTPSRHFLQPTHEALR
ncbi:hypothetical protein AVEN_96973-1 [Araneus ventricosus]|uniref:Uncharacterized protein n=1 Tax=Araneus ventricosus TaxID=182803 RepID=A0A4Y2NLK2_ARAVE|nr:hypothetical protein AVEN_96973-1 [Araneus ventricosus]